MKGKAKVYGDCKFYKIAFCAVRSQPQVDDEQRLFYYFFLIKLGTARL